MADLMDCSLQLAAFPASTDRIIIRVLRVLFHFQRIPCSLSEVCVQKQILVASVFIRAHLLLLLQYQECLFLLYSLISGAR